jgi:hypothetical protein
LSLASPRLLQRMTLSSTAASLFIPCGMLKRTPRVVHVLTPFSITRVATLS